LNPERDAIDLPQRARRGGVDRARRRVVKMPPPRFWRPRSDGSAIAAATALSAMATALSAAIALLHQHANGICSAHIMMRTACCGAATMATLELPT